MLPLLLLMLLSHSRWVATANVTNGCNSIAKNIFILSGQSNMSGRGGVFNQTSSSGTVNLTWDGIVPPECQPNPSVLRLNGGLTWVEAHEPLHKDIDVNKTCGVGPGMSFANELKMDDPDIGVIGLVPCAIGGTNITQWVRGGWLYNEMIRRTKVALQGGGTIRGMLWYQGESDAIDLDDAKLYKGRLKKFFKDVRRDLELPTLPIVQVALATAPGPYMEVIRKAQLGINLPNVRCVDAKGLPIGPDLLHLTTPAQVQLGKMLANAFLQTQRENAN
ncbi:probable carbohydrate esterase At4g34215 isoform X2 [Solanum stenotomum]|uniref:probable carbohydrate esterase At4g34215 isoform X2 n=1 Tax=Solanum stenotomum TaxID=172797 RepID=UPI0020D0FE33|nr:probable carbohydrate esterase At4g34215 isoform X2 [Solanum stenotomum]